MKLIYKYQAELITLLVIAFSLFFIQPSEKYKKPINGDLKGYYAYLPAIFIYNDLQYSFVEEVEEKYYPKSHFKEFRNNFKGKKVNKTFVGLSILIAPFFLLAHGMSALFGFETDGYSILYQWSVVIAIWFYLWMSLRLLIRVLKYFGANSKQSLLLNCLLIFGTNITYYVSFDFTVSHIYSLFLINSLIYYCIKFKENTSSKKIISASLIFGLLVIIRPTNLLAGLLIFTVFNTKEDFQFLKENLLAKKNLIFIGASLVLVFLIPIIFWYLQTEHYLVYSYGEEGFDFSKPEILNMLFSYKKGWLLYNPILIFAFAGWIISFKSKIEGKLALFYTLLMVYIYSCWWIWTFGAGFGQRVFIEYSFLYVLGGLFLIQKLNVNIKRILLIPILLIIGLNIVQAIQTYKGILPGGKVTSEIYWENFLSFKKKARYRLSEDYKELLSFATDLEQNNGWNNESYKTDKDANSGKYSFELNNKTHFSVSKKFDFNFIGEKEYHLVMTAEIKAITKLLKTSFVIDIENEDGEKYYKLFPVNI